VVALFGGSSESLRLTNLVFEKNNGHRDSASANDVGLEVFGTQGALFKARAEDPK
jgi:hypothetical protein